MIKTSTIKLNTKLLTWAMALICFSYPISIVLFIKLGIPTGPANIALKAFFVGLCIISLMMIRMPKKKSLNISFLVFFFIIYGFRLMYDASIGVQNVYYSNTYVYLYYFVLTVLPCLTLIWGRDILNIKYFLNVTFVVIALSNLFYFYYSTTEVTSSFTEQLAGRINVESNTVGSTYTTIINPLSVGRFGVLISLLCSYKILFSYTAMKKIEKLCLVLLFMIGIANILLSSSRGPLLTFIIFFLIILYSYFKVNKINEKMFIKVTLFIAILVSLLIYYIIPIVNSTDIFLFKRVEMFFDGGGVEEARSYSYIGAINDFINNPIFGSQFVGTYDNFYPHNLILEVLMAVGLFGGFFFFKPFFSILNFFRGLLKKRFKPNIFIIYIVGLSLIMLSLTSGSIYTNPEFWVFFTLLIILQNYNDHVLLNKRQK